MSEIQRQVCIKSVSHYDVNDVSKAVLELLSIDPELVAWLNEADPTRLVVVKPNWVNQAHLYDQDSWESLITHATVVLAVVKHLAEMMKGQGTICLCDAPLTGADFESIISRGGLKNGFEDVRRDYPELTLELLDLRREVWIEKEEVVVKRIENPHDPRGYVRFNLGRDSFFYGFYGEGNYYGADYDTTVVNSHHTGETQEYMLAGTPVACDLFVNLPKLKTHKKTGLTCSLKNLVGINGDKNWLPHHTNGAPSEGGDAYPDKSFKQTAEESLKRVFRQVALKVPLLGPFVFRKVRNVGKSVLGDSTKVIRNGNWEGNDTCWRMSLDLNRALLFGTMEGGWREKDQPKRYLSIVDGIIGGEGNGPLAPDDVHSGVLIGGRNPAAVDATAGMVMGLPLERLPIVQRSFGDHPYPIANFAMSDIVVHDEREQRELSLKEVKPAKAEGFTPHFGWPGLKRQP